MPDDKQLWQEFLQKPGTRQIFSLIGNQGITLLAVGTGVFALWNPFDPLVSPILLSALILFTGLNAWAAILSKQFPSKGIWPIQRKSSSEESNGETGA